MRSLTTKQSEILSWVVEYCLAHDYQPSVREIAEGHGISIKGASDHIAAIEKKGFLRTGKGRPRAMKINGLKYIYQERETDGN